MWRKRALRAGRRAGGRGRDPPLLGPRWRRHDHENGWPAGARDSHGVLDAGRLHDDITYRDVPPEAAERVRLKQVWRMKAAVMTAQLLPC